EVRMPERRRVAVVLLPVGLAEQRLELLEHRRARIRRQNLALRERRPEIRRVIDRRRNRIPVILQESEDVERRRDDALSPAVIDDLALMRLRNRPPPGFSQRRRIERLDAEAHRAEAGVVQPIEQIEIEPIEPRFRLERQPEAASLNFIAQRDAPIALLAEQRIAEDDIRLR